MSACRKSAKVAVLLLCGVGLLCDARRLRALPDEVVATRDNTHMIMDENLIRMLAALVASLLVRDDGPPPDTSCGGTRLPASSHRRWY